MKAYLQLYLFLIIIVFSSCQDPIQEISWDSGSIPQKLVVEGHLTSELAQHPIQLSLSDEYFSNESTNRLSGATVRIRTSSASYNYEEVEGKAGYYQANTPFRGQPDTEYTLEIDLDTEIDGETNYSAKTHFAEGLRIDSVIAELMVNPFMEEEGDSLVLGVFIYGQDPASEENHYRVKFLRNDTLLTDTVSDYFYFTDIQMGLDGKYGFILFVNEEYLPDDKLGIEIQCIPESYYDFIVGLQRISSPGDPFGFSGPPANAVGNISSGKGLGFFYAGAVSYGETYIYESIE